MPDDDRMPTSDEIRASIRAFMNRRRYTRFDRAILASIPDSDLELAIQDYVIALIGDDFSTEESVLRALSPGFRAIYTTLHVEAEVCNGGFSQYFSNSEGKLADLAVEGFRHIGAPEYADLMSRAIGVWRKEQDVIEPLGEHSDLDPLDDEFDALAKVSELSQLRIALIRSHPDEFTTG